MSVFKRGVAITSAVIIWSGEVSSWLIVFVVLFVVIDIFGRYALNLPVPGTAEVGDQMMVFITSLAVAYAELKGIHIRIGVIDKYLTEKQICLTNILACLIGISIYSVIFYRGLQAALFSLSIREVTATVPWLPVYAGRFSIVFGSALFVLQLIIGLARNIARIKES